MPNNVSNVINEFTKKVRELLGDRLKKIILYGSYARVDVIPFYTNVQNEGVAL